MPRNSQPRTFGFHIRNVGVGFLAAAVFVVMALGFDIAGLAQSSLGAVVGLWIVLGVICSGLQVCVAHLCMEDDDDDRPGGGTRAPVTELMPVRVPVHTPGAKPRRRL